MSKHREKVTVGCRVPGGLTLQVTRRNPDLGEFALRDAGIIELAGPSREPTPPGRAAQTEAFTQVDKEQFDLWMEENEGGSIVASGAVFLSKAEEPVADQPSDDGDDKANDDGGDKPKDAKPKAKAKDAKALDLDTLDGRAADGALSDAKTYDAKITDVKVDDAKGKAKD